jgi:glycosyltransferase involved in cell wall biosynthesis
MKIALYNLTTTTKSGGIETFNRELASALAKRGHIVHIYGGKGNIIQDIYAGASIYTYPYIKREFIPDFGSRFRKLIERLSFSLFNFKDIIRGNYDYIYISKPFDIPVALLSSFYSRAKTIFGSGGTEFFPGYKYLAKKLDFFFACSEFNALQIEQYCGIKPLVLPNGVNTELFKPRNPDLKLKCQLKLTNNENIVISVCRLVGWKGIQYGIKAVAKLIEKSHSITYLIVGDGEYKKDLEILAKNLHLSDQVMFIGNIRNTELPRYYSIADIAIFPSIANETFGISIAEAMACGMPVISTNVGGIPEVVHKGSGFLVPPKDDNFLAEAIETLLLNDSLREEMGKAGRKWIVENFSWDIVIEKFEDILEARKKQQ